MYFEGWGAAIAGDADLLDMEDKLLFLYKDSGIRRNEDLHYDGEILHEIQLFGTNGENRYVYLVKGSRLTSD